MLFISAQVILAVASFASGVEAVRQLWEYSMFLLRLYEELKIEGKKKTQKVRNGALYPIGIPYQWAAN